MARRKQNLFLYGSLRDPKIFKSVCGISFTVRSSKKVDDKLKSAPAFLPGYKKVSPDNVYFYAVKSPSSRIEGRIVFDVPPEAMDELDKYEGKRYTRQTVNVNTAKGTVKAKSYLVSQESMKLHFGDRFHVNLIHELWLRKRIEKFLTRHTRPGDRTRDARIERLAQRELLATTERDLVISHFGADAVSDYYLEHELDRPRPTITHLYKDDDAIPYINKYLTLVIRQVLLNQLEEKLVAKYRFELEHMRTSERYFKRSVGLLAAMQMLNANKMAVNMIVDESLETMPYYDYDLIDYVKFAVNASDSLFDSRVARAHLERIRVAFQPGLVPLGAEVELSNLGYKAIESNLYKKKVFDTDYDGFRYFHDFALDVLAWKMGAYIDNHTGDTDRARRVGFLELAPGRLNVAGELSRPATADPWLLNQLIQGIVDFYDVQPHSLHLSFQLRKRHIAKQKPLPLGFVKCLLVLGGGLQRQKSGQPYISRMVQGEIIQFRHGEEELAFARTSKRKWYLGEDEIAAKVPAYATTHIQQYKFIRLKKKTNYEPLILCLKGLQLQYNPGDYLTAEQLRRNKKLQYEYEELKNWAKKPTPISPQTIQRFIDTIKEGLMIEANHSPAHHLHYIDWAINEADIQLGIFNQQFKQPSKD